MGASFLTPKSSDHCQIGPRSAPGTSNLATTSALTAAENEIPNVSSLVKKTEYDTKVNEIEIKNY